MRFFLLLLIAGLFLLPVGLTTNTNAQSPVEPPVRNLAAGPYQVGERLTYHVAYASFNTAAHLEIWIAGRGQYLGRDGLELRGHVETTDIVNAALFAINNDYLAYIDPANGLPYYNKFSIHEGGRNAEFAKEYNAAVGTDAIPPSVNRGEFLGAYDVVSAVYRLRNSALADGAVYNATIRGENTEFEVQAKQVGHKLIKSSIGSFNAIMVEISFPHNGELNKYRIKAYFTEDSRHVPLLATARVREAEVRIEIASSEIVPPVKPPTPTGRSPIATTPPSRSTPPNPTTGQTIPGIPGISTGPVTTNPGGNIPGIPGTISKGDPTGAANPSGSLAVRPFPNELPFTADEILNYTVFLQGATQPVGLVSFHVNGRNFFFGKDAIMVSAKAETANAAQRLFLANEQMTSYLDPVSLLPGRTEAAFQGARSGQSDTVQMDQERGTAGGKKGQIEIPVGTHDLLSFVYALRAFDLSPGKTTVIPVLLNGKLHELNISSLQRETIQLGNQKIPAFQLSILADGAQPDRFALRLWISDDRRRLPLRLTAKTPLGQITADLAITATR
jgi:hypothetical protein